MTLLKSFLIAGLMIMSLLLANRLTPTELLADDLPPINLSATIPSQIGEWSEMPDQAQAVIDPTQQEVINQLYSETLARSYVNKQGYVVMLSIAYGKSQQDGVEVHTPDICYPAQGFAIDSKEYIKIKLNHEGHFLIAKRINTNKDGRVEPLVYWTTLGEYVYKSHLQKKLIEYKYSLDKKIPDGMIIRVSSIDVDSNHGLEMQEKFIKSMYFAMNGKESSRLFGRLTAN